MVRPWLGRSQHGRRRAGRNYRVGGLSTGPRTAPYFVEMFDELRRAGFVEAQNLTIDWHRYGPRIDLIPEFVAELVKSRVDVIYASGDIAIRAAQQVTRTIPILGAASDMVGSGLVDSLARPGGNTTGVSILAAELDGKRQEILIEAVPGIRRMAAVAESNATTSAQVQALQDAARARNVELSIHWITSPEESRRSSKRRRRLVNQGRHRSRNLGYGVRATTKDIERELIFGL